MMTTVALSLDQIHDLAIRCLRDNGCDAPNASAVAHTVSTAERDGSMSHGLFRIPGYVASLRSGKVNGHADPKVTTTTPVILRVHGDDGFAPLALNRGLPALADAATQHGIAALAVSHVHHFAALWPETEALAERGLVGLACTAYMPVVAPAGGSEAFFGTNPISFAWPRPGTTPFVFDMATAAMAMGEVQIAEREGHAVPLGTGLDAQGRPTTNPGEILKGVLLPFGGYKGSAIAMMVELLASGMVGERFSFEAHAADNHDGGPPRGGEFLLAMSPEVMAGSDWTEHCEGFFTRIKAIEGVRLPGERRHKNRTSNAPRDINATLVDRIRALCNGG